MCNGNLLNKLRKITLSYKSIYCFVDSINCFKNLVVVLAVDYELSLLAHNCQNHDRVCRPDICLRFILNSFLNLRNEFLTICGHKTVNSLEKLLLSLLDFTVILDFKAAVCLLQRINKFIPACYCEGGVHIFIFARICEGILKSLELLGNS